MSRTDQELKDVFDKAFDKAWGGPYTRMPAPATHAACRAVYEQGFQDGIVMSHAIRVRKK